MQDDPLDITIVASRRPQLLENTLGSFQKNLFSAIPVGKVIVNIDPIFGSLKDHENVIEVILNNFKNPIILQPENPNFCRAVMQVWAQTTSNLVFHLEDDWLCRQKIELAQIRSLMKNDIRQIALMAVEKNWDIAKRGNFHYRPRKIFGRMLDQISPGKLPNFTTSPSFLQGDFARKCAELMCDEFDPEKQFSPVNPPLWRYVRGYKNHLFENSSGTHVIEDIGRQWRETRNIEKVIVNSQSFWRVRN